MLGKPGSGTGKPVEAVEPGVGSPEPEGGVVLVFEPGAVVLVVQRLVLFAMAEHNISSR